MAYQAASGALVDSTAFHHLFLLMRNLTISCSVGLADLHNVDKEGRACIAHTDITASQFVFVNKVGRFLLNDFNRCRFIAWDKRRDKACNFKVGSNPGTVRFLALSVGFVL